MAAQETTTKATAQIANIKPSSIASAGHTQLARTQTEQRQSAIGLARFKVSRGAIARAKEIADQLGMAYSDIGIITHTRQPMTA